MVSVDSNYLPLSLVPGFRPLHIGVCARLTSYPSVQGGTDTQLKQSYSMDEVREDQFCRKAKGDSWLIYLPDPTHIVFRWLFNKI